MSINVSGVNNPQTIENNNNLNQNVKQNEQAATPISDTITSSPNLSSQQKPKLHQVEQVLSKTYLLASADVTNIQAFINALDTQVNTYSQGVTNKVEKNPENPSDEKYGKEFYSKDESNLKDKIDSRMNIKSGVFTTLKSLCAKIASFFGDNSKIEKLQAEGLAQFSELKELLTQDDQGKKFLKSFIEDHSNTPEVMAGMFKSVFGQEYGNTQEAILKSILNIGNNDDKQELLDLAINGNFSDLKKLLTHDQGKAFLKSFIEDPSATPDIMAGMFKSVFGISINNNDSDVAKNVTGLKEILESDESKEILGLINESHSLKIDKFSIKIQKILCDKLEKLKIENCNENSITKNITDLFRGINFCNLDSKEIDKNKAQFYSSSLAQFAGRFGTFFEEFKKLDGNDLQTKFNEFKSVLNNTKIDYKLMGFIKDGASMQGLTRTNFIGAARKSLGDEEFLSQFKSEILDVSLKIQDKDLLAKLPIDLKNKKELEGFAKAFLWADKNDVKEGLKGSLSKPNSKILEATECSKEATLFKDLERGYCYTFIIDGKKISLNEEHKQVNQSIIFAEFEKQLENLSQDQQTQIKEFCANFASQGCFDIPHEIAGNRHPSFVVDFDTQTNDTKIQVTTEGENPIGFSNFGNSIAANRSDVFKKLATFKPSMSPNCQFSFTYPGGIVACKGSASNISVQKYEQNLTFAE